MVTILRNMKNISDIKHTLYINLEHREDRKKHVEEELNKIGIQNPERFDAIKMDFGAIGCSMSHLKCLQIAKENNWPHLLICEDDILFLDPGLFIQQLNTFLENHQDDWDVVLLAGNNTPPYKEVDDTCVQVGRCQTTTAYIVKSHYYDALISNISESVEKLTADPYNRPSYAIDRYWFTLQEQDRWFLIVPLSVIQKNDYSDIEKRHIDYNQAMMDMNIE